MKTTISTASPVRIGRQRRMSEPTGPKPSSRKGYFYFLYEELLLSLSELLCRTRGHDGRKFVCSYQGRLLTLDRTLPYWEYILVLFSRSGCKLWEWQQLVKWPAPVFWGRQSLNRDHCRCGLVQSELGQVQVMSIFALNEIIYCLQLQETKIRLR